MSVKDELYKYFNTWQRLESRCRDNEFEEGLEARTADPLWFLSRQWQLGEFQAEDAGSLVNVEVQYRSDKITNYLQANGNIVQLDETSPPLEALVEREPIKWDWRMRIRTGQQFERLLHEVGKKADIDKAHINEFIQALRDIDQCGIERPKENEYDRTTRYQIRLFAGKGIDGKKLWDKILNGTLQNPNGQLDQTVIDDTITQIKAWYRDLFSQPTEDYNPAWQPNTLDYRFGLTAPNGDEDETKLVTNNYRNGELDWYSSNLENDPEKGRINANKTATAPPTRVSFSGMPHPRWWAMEDYAIDLGQMDVATSDLIKMLLAEFALVYGDDWFVVPLALKVGTINHIAEVRTTDVFGKKDKITQARVNSSDPLNRWDLFSLANDNNPRSNSESDFLYIPYSSGFREESAPVEEVRFIRDEGANKVWGVEHTAPNQWGKPVSVFDLQSEKLQEQQNENVRNASVENKVKESKLAYELASTVPPNWIPFIPVRISTTNNQIKLQRAKMPVADNEQEIEPVTRILAGKNSSDEINEEAITRAGVKVQLTKQRARWIDGKTYVWLGRNVLTGKGEGSSGLVFDKACKKIIEKTKV